MSVRRGRAAARARPARRGRRYRPHLTLARCRMPADVTRTGRGAVRLPGTRRGRPERSAPGPQPLGGPGPGTSRWRAGRCGRLGHAGDPSPGHVDWLSFSRMGTAARSAGRSSAVSSLEPLREPGLTAAADALDQRPCLGRHGQHYLPAVGRVRRAAHQAALLEHRDYAGHRRRLYLLVVRELARGHRTWRSSADSAASWMSEMTVSVPPVQGAPSAQAPREPADRNPQAVASPARSVVAASLPSAQASTKYVSCAARRSYNPEAGSPLGVCGRSEPESAGSADPESGAPRRRRRGSGRPPVDPRHHHGLGARPDDRALVLRNELPADVRWWVWTCLTGLPDRASSGSGTCRYSSAAGQDRGRARTARPGLSSPRGTCPADSGSNTVSSTETPGKSTRS